MLSHDSAVEVKATMIEVEREADGTGFGVGGARALFGLGGAERVKETRLL